MPSYSTKYSELIPSPDENLLFTISAESSDQQVYMYMNAISSYNDLNVYIIDGADITTGSILLL